MAKLTWHGHSCFTLETDDGTRIMIDPWLDENPKADIGTADVDRLDYILVSHGHFDHFADCVPLAKRTGATVVSTFELVAFCGEQGVENGHGMNIGGGHDFPFGRVKLTPALHTGSVHGDDAGTHTTDCAGFLITLNSGKRIYHAGDTALIMDMQLLRGQVDVAHPPHRRQLHHGSGGRGPRGGVHRALGRDADALRHLPRDRAGPGGLPPPRRRKRACGGAGAGGHADGVNRRSQLTGLTQSSRAAEVGGSGEGRMRSPSRLQELTRLDALHVEWTTSEYL
jgi:hypothetical protein